MATIRAERPAKKPGAGKTVPAKSASKKKASSRKAWSAKKPSKKKSAAKKSAGMLRRELAAKREAAIEKRKHTVSATRVDVGPEPVVVDAVDEVAVANIAKRQVRGRTAV